MTEYVKTNTNSESEVEEFRRLFSKKFTDLYSENGKIITVKTTDTNAKTWLESKGLSAKS